MKVALVNGSPHAKGTTYAALSEVSSALKANGIETEIIQVGAKPVAGCLGCGKCRVTGACVFGDVVNRFVERLNEFDGFVFGSPVHYASASGAITSFLDRVFYSGSAKMAFKPGAVVACARRGGTTATLDQLTKYLTINQMPVVSSQYWNMVHGHDPEEARRDLEGMQTMRVLGNNMAWLLKCIEAGKQNGVTLPEREDRVWTNFIQ